jgi:hypothetical protein
VGLFDGLVNHESELDPRKAQSELGPLLGDGERLDRALRLGKGHIVFTNRRLVFVDRPGLNGAKVEYTSIPWRSITRFSVGARGNLDPEAELRIWIAGEAEPIEREFTGELDVYPIQALIAGYVGR